MMRVIELKESITASNDRDADALREEMRREGTLLVNLMSSPGSGKTTLLSRIIEDLGGVWKVAVLEADIDAQVDAERIEQKGARSIQVHTDGMCHMDAGMTRTGLREMGTEGIDLAFLENVGNLICPAEFDTGAGKNVMLLSVPEGDDKPLKYPLKVSADVHEERRACDHEDGHDACIRFQSRALYGAGAEAESGYPDFSGLGQNRRGNGGTGELARRGSAGLESGSVTE